MSTTLTKVEQRGLYKAAEDVMEYAISAWVAVAENGFRGTKIYKVDLLCAELLGTRIAQYRPRLRREEARDLLIALAVMGAA